MIDVSSFVKYLRFERNYSDHTIRSYEKDLLQFYQYLVAHLDLNDIHKVSQVHIRSWIVYLMKSGYRPQSTNRKLSTLKSYFKFQQKLGIISSNPATRVSGPKLSKRLPQVVREQEIDKGLNLLMADDTFKSLRDLVLVNLLYQTGIRRSELINLKESDINFARLSLKVLGKGNKERLVPISKELADLILYYTTAKQEAFTDYCNYLLITDKGHKMYPKFVYNKVHHWISQVSTIDKRSPHILRHSFATHLADHGAELNAIKELLGHASLAATEIYTHNSIKRLKDVYRKAHPSALEKR